MTKDQALQMCLEYIETDAHERKYVRHAIKQALAAKQEHELENEPHVSLASVREDWGPGPHEVHSLPPAQPAPVKKPVIDHSCKDTYELIMKWADIYAAQTGNLYAQAAQDPSKVARMADERTMLACVVAQAISQPPAPDLLNALKRIVDEPKNTMSDGKALKEIIRIARNAITNATGEKL